jgi:hypothetical protein
MEHDVVVQVVWFAFAGRNAVNVKAGQDRGRGGHQLGAGLLQDFTASGVPDFGIAGLDMPAGQEPAIERAGGDGPSASSRGRGPVPVPCT